MTSNRPYFLSSFFTAFRAHHPGPAVIPKPGATLTTVAGANAGTPGTAASAAWTAATTSYTGPTTQQQPAASTPPRPTAHPDHPRKVAAAAANRSTSPGFGPQGPSLPLQHNVSPRTHAPPATLTAEERPPERMRAQGPSSSSSLSTAATPARTASADRRRGSDSSSEGGFRDVASARGAERWYIGGKTARGEERFYKLSMVRARDRSADRLSADRLSL